MKIVYCLPQLYRPGGIERIIAIKANYLADVYRYDVTLVVADQQGYEPYYKLSDKINLVNLDLNYDATLSYPIWKRLLRRFELLNSHKRRLAEVLLYIQPDITISTFTQEATFLPSIKDGSKKVLEFHFCRGHKRIMADSFKFPLFKRMAYYLKCWQEENFIIPKYDQFVVLTEEDKLRWMDKIPNVVSIPNILSFKSVKVTSQNNYNAIAVGRFDEQKGFDTLISMWKSISYECPNWNLHIYGQGRQENLLNHLIEQYHLSQSVFLHQPEKNISSCYANSSLLLMSSRYEGWGLVITEAMQCGLPVVAFGCKCGPKDILSEEEDGFCIPEGDEKKFINTTIKLMKDKQLRLKMGKKAQTNVQRYSPEKVMPLWNQLFNNL